MPTVPPRLSLLLSPSQVANVGAAACLLGRIVGSFNAKLPEGFFLSTEHTLRCRRAGGRAGMSSWGLDAAMRAPCARAGASMPELF